MKRWISRSVEVIRSTNQVLGLTWLSKAFVGRQHEFEELLHFARSSERVRLAIHLSYQRYLGRVLFGYFIDVTLLFALLLPNQSRILPLPLAARLAIAWLTGLLCGLVWLSWIRRAHMLKALMQISVAARRLHRALKVVEQSNYVGLKVRSQNRIALQRRRLRSLCPVLARRIAKARGSSSYLDDLDAISLARWLWWASEDLSDTGRVNSALKVCADTIEHFVSPNALLPVRTLVPPVEMDGVNLDGSRIAAAYGSVIKGAWIAALPLIPILSTIIGIVFGKK
jgi:hypothetical protein